MNTTEKEARQIIAICLHRFKLQSGQRLAIASLRNAFVQGGGEPLVFKSAIVFAVGRGWLELSDYDVWFTSEGQQEATEACAS